MQFHLAAIDYAILGVYFVFVLGIGWRLRTACPPARTS